MPYVIGIELGSMEVRAAVCLWTEGRWTDPGVVPLGTRDTAAAAAVFIAADGEVLFGDAAEERGRSEPDRVVGQLGNTFGDPRVILIGGKSWGRVELLGRLVGWIVDQVTERQREPPMRIAIAEPVSWGSDRRELLEIALPNIQSSVVVLSQTQAAALALTRTGLINSAAPIAVCHLGRDGVQIAVLRADGELLGTPEGLDDLDTLSAELDDYIDRLTAALRATVASAGFSLDQLSTAVLIGARSREQMITLRMSELLQCPITVGADPENTAVRGAAIRAQSDQAPVPADVDRSLPATTSRSWPAGIGATAPDRASVAGSTTTPGVDDDTQFTVYRPANVRPQRWYPLLAFVHRADPFVDPDSGELVDPVDLVRSEADRLLTDQSERYHPVTADSELILPSGSEITLQPWLSSGEFNPPQATFRLEEPVHRVEFRFRAAPHAAGRRVTGGLRVYLGLLLAGEVRFTTDVSMVNPPPRQAGLERIPVRRFRHIFASYSHLDSDVVTAVADYATAVGDRYLIDAVALRSGEQWEPRLNELIEQSDIFQLFWSRNAMYSVHVQREWEHALRLNRNGFIRPVYWEEPRPTDPTRQLPPPGIGQLHWARLPIRLTASSTNPPAPDRASDPPSAPGINRSTQWGSQPAPVSPDVNVSPPDAPTPPAGLAKIRLWPGPPSSNAGGNIATNAAATAPLPSGPAEGATVIGAGGRPSSAPTGGPQAPPGSRSGHQDNGQGYDDHTSCSSAQTVIRGRHPGHQPIPAYPAEEHIGGDELAPPRDAPPLPSPTPGKFRRGFTVIAGASVAVLLTSLVLVAGLVRGDLSSTTTAAAPPVTPVVPASPWRELRPDPTPRQQVGATVADGTVWVLGGITSGAATPLVEGYDPAIDTWKAGVPLPVPLSHEMAVPYRGEIVVLGGWEAQGGNLTAVSSKKVYAQRGGGWVELPPMLSSHVAGGAVVVGDQIIVSGGQADGKLNPTTEVFDGTAWKRVSDLPTPREHLGMATDGTYAYVVGGRDLSSDKNSGALERYDPKTDSWAALAAMPAPRGGVGAAVADGRLVVAGGEEPTSVDNSVYAYDIASNTWSDLPPLPTGRHGLAVAAVDKTIYAIGGATQASHTASTGVGEALQIPPRRLQPAPVWRPMKDAPVARQFTGTAVAGGKMWVLGGLTQDAATPAVYGYDPAIDTWTRGPDLPLQLHHLAAVTYRDELVVIGGWAPANGNLSGLVSGKVFALRNGAWVELPPLTHPRVAHAAAVVGDKIVVVGGQADNQLIAPTEVFDGTKWADAAPIPTPREHLSATTDGTYVYAVGGRNLSSDKNTAAFERFDPATGAWQTMPNMPTPRGGVAATFVDGRIVAAGGEEPTRVLATVEAYDVATGTWSPLPSLPAPRHGIALATVGNSIYAVGGAQRPTHAQSAATVEALDFS